MKELEKRIKQKPFQKERGQSLVEFALILPVLLIFLSGVADTGWLIYNYIGINDVVDTAVHANIKADQDEAERFIESYIRTSFSEFDMDSMTITLTTRVKTYTYFEYIWKINQRKHWKVPMYYKTLKTGLTISYDVEYLTPMGKILFGDTDNSVTLTSHAYAAKVLENESYKREEDEDDEG